MNSMNVTGCVSITMRARLRFNFLALFVHPSCIFGYSVPLENVCKQNAFFEVNQKITQRDRKCFLLWRSRKRFYSFSYASPSPFFMLPTPNTITITATTPTKLSLLLPLISCLWQASPRTI